MLSLEAVISEPGVLFPGYPSFGSAKTISSLNDSQECCFPSFVGLQHTKSDTTYYEILSANSKSGYDIL